MRAQGAAIVHGYVAQGCACLSAACVGANADGGLNIKVGAASVLIFLMEFKNETGTAGGGDPIFQQLRGYQMYYQNPGRANTAIRLTDACPALLVEVVGPLLRIWAVASLHSDTVMAEPLTPFLHCLLVDAQCECVPTSARTCFGVPAALCAYLFA